MDTNPVTVSPMIKPLPRGIYSLGPEGKPFPAGVYKNPEVDGLHIRAFWNQVDTSTTAIDDLIASAESAGKKFSLSVLPGRYTPDRVYAAGAEPFAYKAAVSWDWDNVRACPVPWDEVYLREWTAFVAKLGVHYGSHPDLTYVRVTGVNYDTPEAALPNAKGEIIPGGSRLPCQTWQDQASWLKRFYTRGKVLDSWRRVASAFRAAFPGTPLTHSTFPPAWPPLGDNGESLNQAADWKLTWALYKEGQRILGKDGFLWQADNLQPTWHWKELPKFAGEARATIAYQMQAVAKSLPGGMTPADGLRASLRNGLGSGARLFEVYGVDCADVGLKPALAWAREQIFVGETK